MPVFLCRQEVIKGCSSLRTDAAPTNAWCGPFFKLAWTLYKAGKLIKDQIVLSIQKIHSKPRSFLYTTYDEFRISKHYNESQAKL